MAKLAQLERNQVFNLFKQEKYLSHVALVIGKVKNKHKSLNKFGKTALRFFLLLLL